MSIKGIDISEHNGNFDVRGQGFVMIRSSWGHFSEDRQLRNNVSKCLNAGVPYGLYHYSYARNDEEAYTEARGFLNLARQFGGRSYPLCLDMEDADHWKAGQGVTMAQEIRTIQIFKEVIEGAGEYLLLYVNRDWWNRLREVNASVVDSLDLWLAHWGITEPSVACGMWQYQGSPLDSNIAYKDYPSILSGSITEDKPEETPEETPDTGSIEVGSIVRPKSAVSYDGVSLASFVTENEYKVIEINGNRAVLGNGLNTAFNTNNLMLVSGGTTEQTLEVGMTATPKSAVSYDGVSLASFVTENAYTVIEINGNRVVLGDGLNTAFNINNLYY